MKTPTELLAEVVGVEPGTRILYHTGLLSRDMEHTDGHTKLRLWRLLHMSRSIMNYGVGMLIQRRNKEDEYSYYIVRTEKSGVPPVLGVIAKELEDATRIRPPSSWWGNGTL